MLAQRNKLADDQAVGVFLAALIVDVGMDAVPPKIAAHQVSAISRMQANVSLRHRFGVSNGKRKIMKYYDRAK